MTTPGLHPSRRPVGPRDVALAACALLWIVCSVAVVWLLGASTAAEDARYRVPGYAGPAQDDLELWAALAFYLGAAALLAGICLAVSRRRAGAPQAVGAS